ncbi:MAG: FAD-dependent pyridine nucleotide-disulfide oxidoreductase [Solirubrobacterales bacterium]|nr:FAD-dependent pyridine nucleotide-disulfide oxidoreductase [Solirubrobacterales bacterium]
MSSPLRVAIVGAGPSGFYAAAQLLAVAEPEFSVDLFDRLPTPYGLVRAGVAPDHPKIKSVTKAFDKTARHERFRFFGHVELGTDVTREDLLERYHAVLYSVGTSTDRKLGVPGENLQGSHPATEFVAWYNGHPDHSGLEVDLQAKQAVVVGAGNVAIDVARMLALAPSELGVTDTADHALEVLNASGIEEITILARRGPLQAAFTNPELLEMGELERADLEIVGAELDPLSQKALEDADKTRRRNVEIIQEYAARPKAGKPLTVRFRFLAGPVELLGDEDGHVRAVRIEENEITARGDGSLAAGGTGRFEELPAQLVFRSIGYTGVAVPGVAFDEDRGLIRNDGGRVVGEDGAPLPGEYVAGWIKRGPSGVIGTNKKDAQDTVRKLLEDAAAGALNEPGGEDVEALLAERCEHLVSWEGWEAIDTAEREAGEPQGRPRVKLAEWDALREAAKAGRPVG